MQHKLNDKYKESEFDLYYTGKIEIKDQSGVKHKKKMLSKEDCEGKTIHELHILKKVYILPPIYLEEVEDYRDTLNIK